MKLLFTLLFTITFASATVTMSQYSNALETVYETESITIDDLGLNDSDNLSIYDKAFITRKIENGGKYTGKAKGNSSAWGAYMFTRATRTFILKQGLRVNGVRITRYNWTRKSHQDAMYRWYSEYLYKTNSNIITTRNMFTDYMGWQCGAGGLKIALKVLNGDGVLKTNNIRTFYRNLPRSSTKEFEEFLAAKLKVLTYERDLHVPSHWTNRSRLTYNQLRRIINVYNKDYGDTTEVLESSKNELVIIWAKYYKHKVDGFKRLI